MPAPARKPCNNYKIDAEKLGQIISELANDVQGSCVQAGACVGKTALGRNIVVFVGGKDSDASNYRAQAKFRCVTHK